LLHFPIRLNQKDPINLDAPWRNEQATDAERMEFASAFSPRFEPLAALPIETDSGWLQGQLWLHSGSTYGNADNRSAAVYVRGMLLAENDVDLLPRWAGFVSCVVESSDLTPTASRETLQKDSEYAQAQMVLSDTLITGLTTIANQTPAIWRRVVARHGEAIRGAAIADDRLFELVAEQLLLPTSQGDRTAASLRVGRCIHVSLGTERGFEEVMFVGRGIPVAWGHRYGVLPFLRRYADLHGLELIEIGTDAGNALIFEDVVVEPKAHRWLHDQLIGQNEELHVASFEPKFLPLVVIPDREAELKRRVDSDELDKAAGSAATSLARLHTASIDSRPEIRVYLNMACPTIQHLVDACERNPVGATQAAAFLRAIKAMMTASDRERAAQADLGAGLGDVLTVLDGLLLANPDAGSDDEF